MDTMTLDTIKISVPEGHDQGFHESRLTQYLSPLFAEVGAEEELYDLAIARDGEETSESHDPFLSYRV